MKRRWVMLPFVLAMLAGSAVGRQLFARNLRLVNAATGRLIPVAIYGASTRKPLAIVLAGYGNKATAYRFLTEALVARGFVVAALELELPGDLPMPRAGDAALVRRPFWRVGVASIDVAVRWIRDHHLSNARPLVLVGHSNGGDVAMLFATDHPDAARVVFSLDNRRMPIPRVSRPHICSIRSTDQRADPAVIPSTDDLTRFDIVILTSTDLPRDDMWDGGSGEQKKQILDALSVCLSYRGR